MTLMSRGEGRRVLVAALASLTLLGSACGARLSEQDKLLAIAAQTRGHAAATTGAAAGGPASAAGAGAAGAGSSVSGSVTGPQAAAATSNRATGPTTTGPTGTTAGTCARATKATDTGVTPTKIVVATLADISGVQPGLFESAHQAARAASAYINSQGGICGRQVQPLLLDSKTDSGGNRAAMLDACEKSFAAAGSMSAFDDGSAAPGQQCGIPDMTAITTNKPKLQASDVYPMFPSGSGIVGTSPPRYIAKRYPDAIKHAAIIWLNQAVTKANAVQREAAWKSVGFKFVYETEAQVLEANYTRFVQEMRSRGVQYVTMVSDFQSIVRLQRAMRQQNYVPKVRDWDSVAYDPDYLDEKSVVEGSFVFINVAMFEEASSNPEMKLYTEWLQRASPGATPDYFGVYAWSAYRLFQKLATEIGPDLTRKKLLGALKATKEWGDYGLTAPHRVGEKLPSTCNIYLHVVNGKFERMYPASGFDCSGKLYYPK
jgi:ABC-type branched-subunit amino acid transport system substrate-binding protein